jgi:hypothetical protein
MNALIKYKSNVRYRSDLFTLLSEACELEHGLACSYLYSAFSLKKSVGEGLTAEQLHYVRKWAAKIYFIAAQEMLHLSQVWNLLTAIGGTPYYFRPNFPQPSKYYPFNVPLKLEPFSLEALQRFILYELPSYIDEKAFAKKTFGYISEDDYSYKTVGELYTIIKEGITAIDEKELFIGDPNLQIGKEEIDFHEIIKIYDRSSAIDAIDMITEQGEGTKEENENSHYLTFVGIEKEYKEILKTSPDFQPSRKVLTNPITFLKGNYSTENGEVIINNETRSVSDIFDDVYNLMLRSLQFAFSYCADKEVRKRVSDFSIHLMIRIIKPLGEILTELPAYSDLYLKKAGASFALTRHIPLPPDSKITCRLISERGEEILLRLIDLKAEVPQIVSVCETLADVLHTFGQKVEVRTSESI